jgi:hypothetical protein
MGVYDRQIASALRMIKKYGQPVTITQDTVTKDPDQPWVETPGIITKPDVMCAFFPPTLRTMQTAGITAKTDVPMGYAEVYIGQIAGFQMTPKDRITDKAGNIWNIKYFNAINPNGDGVILYEILLLQ